MQIKKTENKWKRNYMYFLWWGRQIMVDEIAKSYLFIDMSTCLFWIECLLSFFSFQCPSTLPALLWLLAKLSKVWLGVWELGSWGECSHSHLPNLIELSMLHVGMIWAEVVLQKRLLSRKANYTNLKNIHGCPFNIHIVVFY